MKRYLITGGAGFIGSAIVNKLSQENCKVRVFDNEFRTSNKGFEASPKIEYIKGDIRDPMAVYSATKNVDVIIHLAFINGTKFFYEKPDLVLEVGVKGMLNVLDAARDNKVKELYLASSSEVYQAPAIIPTPENIAFSIPDPLNPRYSYAGGKIISELMAIHMGSKFLDKVVIFRPHNVYGPKMGYEHVIPELTRKIVDLKRKSKKVILPIQGDGSSTRAFIYIDDFTDAVMLLLKKSTNMEIYNIGTEEETSIKQLVDILSKVTGTSISVKTTKQPEGGAQRRCPDATKIKKLGFVAKTPLAEGLKKTYLWYNDELKQDEQN